jgi:transposase
MEKFAKGFSKLESSINVLLSYTEKRNMGNLLCVHVHAANIHDTKGGVFTFKKALYKYPFEVQPLRWKVKRTLSWFQSSRRLSKDVEMKAVYAETMCAISHIHTLLRRS